MALQVSAKKCMNSLLATTALAISSSVGEALCVQKAVSYLCSVQKSEAKITEAFSISFKRLYAFSYAAFTCVTRSL